MLRLSHRCSAALVGTTLVAISAAPAHAGVRRAPSAAVALAWPSSLAMAPESAPAAVVGLDADAPEQGAALTRAMRRAFAARGLSGGSEVSLSELRLALGCKGTDPKCLAEGGELLDARRLIYGTLRRTGGFWQLEATLLEVEGGGVTTASMKLTDAELGKDRIDTTAEEIADRLAPDTALGDAPAYGQADPDASPPPRETTMPAPAARAHAAPGKLHWAWQRPQPRWKWAGFGVSAGVLAINAGATIGMHTWLTSTNLGFRKQLLSAANESLLDSNPSNDVNPNLPASVNLCDYAKARPTDESGNPLGEPGQVRNSHVTSVCSNGDRMSRAALFTAVTAGVALASTALFTVLLFVHREPLRGSARRRHQLYVGADPVRGRGLSLQLGGRF